MLLISGKLAAGKLALLCAPADFVPQAKASLCLRFFLLPDFPGFAPALLNGGLRHFLIRHLNLVFVEAEIVVPEPWLDFHIL